MIKVKRKELSYDAVNKAWVSWQYLPTGQRTKLYLCKGKSRTGDKEARKRAEAVLIEKKIKLNILTPEIIKEQAESKRKSRRHVLRNPQTVGGVIDEYLKSIERRFYAGNIGQGRLNHYYYVFDVFERFLAGRVDQDHNHPSGGPIKILTGKRLQAFADDLRKKIDAKYYTNGSAKGIFWVIKDFFTYAWEERKSDWRPTKRVKVLTGDDAKIEIKVYTPEQVRSLLLFNTERTGKSTAKQRHPLELMVMLGLNLGWQSKDISQLRKSHITYPQGINTPARITKVRTKTKIEGSWALWDLTWQLLHQYIKFRPNIGEDELLFTTHTGRPLSYHLATGSVDLIGRKLSSRIENWQPELKGLSFKHFRKTGATWMANYGEKNPVLAQMYLAHSYKASLKWYAKPDPAELDKALAEMEIAFGFHKISIKPTLRR